MSDDVKPVPAPPTRPVMSAPIAAAPVEPTNEDRIAKLEADFAALKAKMKHWF